MGWDPTSVEAGSHGRSRGWTAPYLSQIARRRYTTTEDATGQGTYRVERFSLRGTYRTPIGSLIERRAGPMRLEVLDLTRPGSAPRAAPTAPATS